MTVQPTRDQLRVLADAATPHPPHESEGAWQTDRYAEYIVVDSEQDCDGEYGHVAEAANERLGAFIAAANPNTIRGLLDQLDQAEARIKAVRELHCSDGHDGTCGGSDCFESCVGCLEDYPCSTIRALEG